MFHLLYAGSSWSATRRYHSTCFIHFRPNSMSLLECPYGLLQ